MCDNELRLSISIGVKGSDAISLQLNCQHPTAINISLYFMDKNSFDEGVTGSINADMRVNGKLNFK